MIHFDWPWLFALLPLPYLAYKFLPQAPSVQEAALWVPTLQPFGAALRSGRVRSSKRWRLALALLLWLLLVTAAARPQWLGDAVEMPVSGRDLMLAVDLSGSMQIEDFTLNGQRVTRLTALKAVASAFIQQRQGDRVGLILFGDKPYIQAPLTFDHATVIRLLQEAFIGLAGKRTAIGDAIGLAIKRLKQQKNSQKVLILLTDGANTAGNISPDKAAQLAAEAGLKIYTIGIGASSMEVGSFLFKRTVNPSVDLDEKTLKHLAEVTGGRYFRAHDTAELVGIYQQLDRLEPTVRDKKFYRPVTALYYWPLGVVLLVALAWLTLAVFRRKA